MVFVAELHPEPLNVCYPGIQSAAGVVLELPAMSFTYDPVHCFRTLSVGFTPR